LYAAQFRQVGSAAPGYADSVAVRGDFVFVGTDAGGLVSFKATPPVRLEGLTTLSARPLKPGENIRIDWYGDGRTNLAWRFEFAGKPVPAEAIPDADNQWHANLQVPLDAESIWGSQLMLRELSTGKTIYFSLSVDAPPKLFLGLSGPRSIAWNGIHTNYHLLKSSTLNGPWMSTDPADVANIPYGAGNISYFQHIVPDDSRDAFFQLRTNSP
jgi:hypothetical protein